MMTFFREQKLIAALLFGSVLVLLLGIGLILYSENSAKDVAKTTTSVQRLNAIAEDASQQLQQTIAHPDVPISDVKPEESIARVSALNGRIPDIGSDDWCEVMMVKNAKDWTEEEQSIFAKNCI